MLSNKIKGLAWACCHEERTHYGKGLCNSCYHYNYYHRKRAAIRKAALKEEEESPKKTQSPN